MDSFENSDLLRKFNNLIRLGTVEEVDYKNAKVRVKTVDTPTDWLRWITCRAGEDRSWSAPSIGEQVIILSPSGDLGNGVVLPAIYCERYPSPEGERTGKISGFIFKDGTVLRYDHDSHEFTVSIAKEGILTFKVKESVLKVTDKEITSQLGKLSLKITDEKIILQVGESSLEITESGIKLKASRIDLN